MSDNIQTPQTETQQEKKKYQAPQLIQHDTIAKLTQASATGPGTDQFSEIS